MDEPLSNLDAKLRVSTRAQIKHLQHDLAVTTIYVTHDQIEAMTLADRVVVMNRGEIQQVGTPTEIYDRPANAFVAGFIGSPSMNLLQGELADGQFQGDSVCIQGLGQARSGPVILGFRAEDAAVTGNDPVIRAPVYSCELLGEATMVTVQAGGALVAVRTPKDFRAAIGDPIEITVPPGKCHLFDRESGKRLD
jgi:multiple sugar transport system ATP-binding protein